MFNFLYEYFLEIIYEIIAFINLNLFIKYVIFIYFLLISNNKYRV